MGRGAWRPVSRLQLSAGWSDAPESSEGVTVRVKATSLGVAYDGSDDELMDSEFEPVPATDDADGDVDHEVEVAEEISELEAVTQERDQFKDIALRLHRLPQPGPH